MKEIQEISAIPETQFEQTRFTVTNPGTASYKLSFKNPKNMKVNIPSKAIPGYATAA